MRLAQKSGVFSEEHDHYLDLYTHAMMRRSALGLGRRFVQAGSLDDDEDIFFLIPDEVRRAGINPDQFDLRYIVDRRKAEWQEWQKTPNPPAILREGFDLDKAMGVLVQSMDPIALKVVVGSMPQVRPELKADLYGTCGSPGVAEGPARVILNEDELHLVQEEGHSGGGQYLAQLDPGILHDQGRGRGPRGQPIPRRHRGHENTESRWS